MQKHLHIISLDVPYPVDYGGVYDLFYKLPALQKQGVSIHLHCFYNDRGPQRELDQYCASVNYYKRLKGLQGISATLPYIVTTRADSRLVKNLLKDDHPILMEGVHTTYPLLDRRFENRRCFVRQHNVEYLYYRHLYQTASSFFKKTYYWRESKLLYNYEKQIINKATFLGVSKEDVDIYKKLGANNISYLPLFLPPWQVSGKVGNGSFCLYQGNLEVDENEKAAVWLLAEVFVTLNLPFVIAGKNPSLKLQALADARPNTRLIANPSEPEMQKLIAQAHIHVLPSFNVTGIKLKLVNALYNGRFCVANSQAVAGSGLETLCQTADTAEELKQLLVNLFDQPYTPEHSAVRHHLLDAMFDNDDNARKMGEWIWGKESA